MSYSETELRVMRTHDLNPEFDETRMHEAFPPLLRGEINVTVVRRNVETHTRPIRIRNENAGVAF